jgi:hypothetical protein
MTRKVLVVGFPGVQALDVVGPFEVFAAASSVLEAQGKAGYLPVVAPLDGQPIDTETGLTFGAVELPDPSEPTELIDTLVLPRGRGTRSNRRDPRLIDWIVAAAPQARRFVTVSTERFWPRTPACSTVAGRPRTGPSLSGTPFAPAARVEWCASPLFTHESSGPRLGNSEDEQARNCCRAGAEGSIRKVVVGDGEHGGIGDLAEYVRGQVSLKYLAVLASLHEVGKDLIDWSQEGVNLLAVFAAPKRQ